MMDRITRLNPVGMPDAGKVGYTQISVPGTSRLAFVSGQVAWRPDGAPVPDTFSEQTAVVIDNLGQALRALDALPADIVQMRIYVTELNAETQDILWSHLLPFLNGALPSLTGIGVAALAAPDLKIEIEMVVQIAG